MTLVKKKSRTTRRNVLWWMHGKYSWKYDMHIQS